jgi:4-amino-4-deoxy-L-arabinose transferase-like glycosyltransferase
MKPTHGAPGALRRFTGQVQAAVQGSNTPLGLWLLIGASALLLLPGLGLYPLFNDDEGAFSEATRELLQSGDWLSTTLNGAPRYDKPILIYWLQAVSVWTLGLNEFALRLPSALAALAWILAIVRFVTPRLGNANGLLAGWIGATSLGVLAMGRAATADALLNALIVATMFDLWRHLEILQGGSGNDRAALRRTYLWMALGLLTKGPIAVLIPVAVSLAYCLFARRWRDWLRTVFDPLGWAILLAVAAPWYLAQWHLHGQEFVDGFLVRHNLNRFHGTLEGHSGSVFYYVVLAPALLLPWSGLLWPTARRLTQEWSEPLSRYLLAWFAFVFVFFSLSGTKLPHYILYGLTPMFVLTARSARAAGTWRNLLVLPCVLLLGLLVLPRALSWWIGTHPGAVPALYVAQAQRAAALATMPYYLVVASCTIVALGASAYRSWPSGRRAVAASGALAVALCYALTPWIGAVLQGPVKDAATFARQRPEAAVQWQFSAPSFSVYRGQITPARPPQPGELAITRVDRLDPTAPVDLLFEEGGVALVRRRDE